jgi:hypothetical protein
MNLLISIGVCVGSNPTLSATLIFSRFNRLLRFAIYYCQILEALVDASRVCRAVFFAAFKADIAACRS